jgi:hypothetical protein
MYQFGIWYRNRTSGAGRAYATMLFTRAATKQLKSTRAHFIDHLEQKYIHGKSLAAHHHALYDLYIDVYLWYLQSRHYKEIRFLDIFVCKTLEQTRYVYTYIERMQMLFHKYCTHGNGCLFED